MQNKIFIDIGNTNFKILKGDEFTVFNIININSFFSKIATSDLYYFSCTNIKYQKSLDDLAKKHKNITIIKNSFFKNLITFANGINIDDVGIDILLQIYWLIYIKKQKDGIILSSGTYLTCVSISDSTVLSINISCGLDKIIRHFEDTIGTKIIQKKMLDIGVDNYSAIFSSFLLQIFGLINYNKSIVKIDNVIFTGLGFNNEILQLIKTKNLVKFEYVRNITLESLKMIYIKG